MQKIVLLVLCGLINPGIAEIYEDDYIILECPDVTNITFSHFGTHYSFEYRESVGDGVYQQIPLVSIDITSTELGISLTSPYTRGFPNFGWNATIEILQSVQIK